MRIFESSIYKLLKKNSYAFLSVSLLVGILLIVIGTCIAGKNEIASRVLITLGASGIGTCVGLAVGSITNSSAVHRIKELIEKTHASSITASDEELNEFRREWHHYLVTRIEGTRKWRYRKMDFSRTVLPGKLSTTFKVLAKDGTMHSYSVEGFISNLRLIFVQTASKGTEQPIIHIYPNATQLYRINHFGIAILESWDGDRLVVPVLLCPTPLLDTDISEGTVDDVFNDKLDGVWKDEVKKAGLKFDWEELDITKPI